ncbi:uncharacterized protein LOC125856105 [Solanum stenotomum]|uniref:uncharacterized protein LOC125856105 n=1 Tax=Solanum stenotomum TaxID=172797 RepID=UPI0020D01434|nr:uncharacterized protein LOC125856105 [Solanum stenotomum]
MEKYFFKVSNSSYITQNQPNREENANHLEVPSHSSQEFDLSSLKADSGERTQILEFHPNHCDAIRIAYLQKKPCQPLLREFPQTNIFGDVRRFNHKWFDEFPDWLEYSISKDAAFCLYCYLFKQNNNLQGGGETFSSVGFRSWQKKASLQTHVGGHTSIHNQSKRKCEDLMRQQQSIHASFEKQFNQDKHGYQIRLAASIDVCDEVRKFVLGNAPQNDQMTCPKIQKDIVIACKIETIKGIIKELNGDYFSLLVDESFDVSRKEQMAGVLRYVDRRGFMMERLLDIVHVKNTSSLSLKEAIVIYFLNIP